jgi:hypothetical protein
VFGLFKKKAEAPETRTLKTEPPKRFPPVPDWQPNSNASLDRIVERVGHYTNQTKDIAVFENGTCVILPDGLLDEDARIFALDVLHKIFNAHPDFHPLEMKDGNTLIRYNHPAVNLVFADVAQQHWAEIDKHHQEALATDEVLLTPRGPNFFDDAGKKALFGRCFMFMDAQRPNVLRVERKTGSVHA